MRGSRYDVELIYESYCRYAREVARTEPVPYERWYAVYASQHFSVGGV